LKKLGPNGTWRGVVKIQSQFFSLTSNFSIQFILG
jgi:hypothetical protein